MKILPSGIILNEVFYYIPELILTKDFDQKNPHHPEKYLFIHLENVANQLIPDVDLFVAAVFHDLGKLYTAKPHKRNPDHMTYHAHEHVSARIFKAYHKKYLFPVDEEKVHWIIKQHMRINRMDEMRPEKQDYLKQHVHYNSLYKFNQADRNR